MGGSVIYVVPRLAGVTFWPVTTNGFTVGKRYRVAHSAGRGGVVRNDHGHERFVTFDGGLSPHIKEHRRWQGHDFERSFGYFEVIWEDGTGVAEASDPA